MTEQTLEVDPQEADDDQPIDRAEATEAEDVIDILRPKSEPHTWALGVGDEQREYVQRPLSYFAKMQFFGLIGEVIDRAMAGDGGLRLGSLFEAPQMRGGALNAADFRDADTFIQAVGKLLVYAPDFLKKCYCIWLNIPDYDRPWATGVMDLPKEEGGFSDDEGIEIIEVFIDQNWDALEDFFRNRLRALVDRTRARQNGASNSRQSKPSKRTRQNTPKR